MTQTLPKNRDQRGLTLLCLSLAIFLLSHSLLKAQFVPDSLLQQKVSSLISKKAFKRLHRYRPLPPFDESPVYSFLEMPIQDSEQAKDNLGKLLSSIVSGPSISLTPKLSLSLDGLMYLIPDYSAEEGYWVGFETMLQYNIDWGEKLVLRSSNNYTLRSHKFYHEHKLYYYFSPEQDGLLLLAGGRTSRQTLPETKSELYVGKYLNPIGANNKLRDFNKIFLSGRATISPLPKLHTTLSLLYEDRRPFLNDQLAVNKLLMAELNLLYDFAFDAPMSGEYPSSTQLPYGYSSFALGLNIRQAFNPSFFGLKSSPIYSIYTMLEGTVRSSWADNIFLHEASFFGGGFVGEKKLYLLDSRHFRSLTFLSPTTFNNAWATLPYNFLLRNQWGGFYWTGTSQKLLLSRTALGIRGLGFDESLHFKALCDFHNRYYAELGYSFGWDKFLRFGFFWGTNFKDKKPNFKFVLNIPLVLLTSQWGERY